MTVCFHMNVSLPKLAWIAEVERKNLAVSAVFGGCVEHSRNFLVAGVWNGRFAEGGFETTDCFFGTGLIVRDDAVTFVPSAGLTDAIYYRESDGRLIAANSLPLLLAAIDDRLDPHFAFYERITNSLQAGIDRYEKVIPTTHGQVLRVFVRNLKVTAARVEEVDKRHPPAFPDFSSYLDYLTDNYASIHRNIRDPDRHHRPDLISTQSRGYDTTAMNTIASRHGIDAVFTIPEPKERGAFTGTAPRSREIDDGSAICRALDLKTTAVDRRLYSRLFEDEYLFYAASNRADSAKFLGIKPHLRDLSVMLTGVHGDVVWATNKYYLARPELLIGHSDCEPEIANPPATVLPEMMANDLRGPDTWLHGLSEVSLKWGLIQVTPSYIGERNRRDIFQVTMSAEMAPWRLGNDYDRPIARRIAEEIGRIPRHYFGQQKMATVTEFPLPPVPVDAQLRREYFAFLRAHRIASIWWQLGYRWIHRINARIIYHTPHHYRYLYYARRLLSKLARRDLSVVMLYPRLDGRLYCFCVNKRLEEYKKIWSEHAAGSDARQSSQINKQHERFQQASPAVYRSDMTDPML